MTTLHFDSHFPFVLEREPAATATETQTLSQAQTPTIDVSMMGAWTAIIVWMALFGGLLYSWFTMGLG